MKRVVEIQGNRLSAVGRDARIRAARRGAPSDDRRHRRGADAVDRNPAGVPGAWARRRRRSTGAADRPSPGRPRRDRRPLGRCLRLSAGGARGAALASGSSTSRRRRPGRRCWTRAPTCARRGRCTGSSPPKHGGVRERRDQLTHPPYAKPELLAERPNELWSWDVSKLKGPAKWTWFYLYVILDVFSRFAARRKTAVLFPDRLCGRRRRGPTMGGGERPGGGVFGHITIRAKRAS